jgi:hypothetical protein
MKTKTERAIKKAEQKRLEDERTVLARCVTKKDLGVRINGIQI